MNQTIDLLMKHCSIRRYSAEKITQEQLHAIIAASQQRSDIAKLKDGPSFSFVIYYVCNAEKPR